MQSSLLPKREDVQSAMREIRVACFALNRRAPEAVLDIAKLSLRWLRELFGQEHASQGRHAARKPEGSAVTEIEGKGAEALVYGDPRPVKRSRRE